MKINDTYKKLIGLAHNLIWFYFKSKCVHGDQSQDVFSK